MNSTSPSPSPFQTPHLNTLLYIALFAAAVCAINLTTTPGFQDTDAQWHIAAGLEILKTGQIPENDPWSINPEQTWYNLSWLYDVLIAIPAYYFGDTGLLLLWFCLSGFLVAEIFRVLKVWVPCPQTRLITTLLCSIPFIEFLSLRPQSLAGLLALYSLAVLHQSRTNPKKLCWLPLISLLWANIHGSLPLMFLFIGVFFLESLIKKNHRLCINLVFWGTISGVTCLINPFGLDIYTGITRTTNSCISPFIGEWAKWSLTARPQYDCLVALVLALTLLLPNKATLSEKILALILLFLSFNSIRFFGLLAVIAAPVLAQQLSILPKLPNRFAGPTLCLSLLIGLFFLNHYQKTIYKTLAEKSMKYTLTEQAINHLLHTHPQKNILNTYEVGGALAHLGRKGHFRHYIDGRAGTAFSETRLQEYLDLLLGKTSLQAILHKYQIDVALVEKTHPANQNLTKMFLKEGWQPELINASYVIFVPPPKNTERPTP
jgi:hypothetical protein